MEKMFDEYLKNCKEMQALWETRTAQMMDEFVKSQSFVNAMTTSLEGYLNGRKAFDGLLSRWAETFGIVTKKDVDTINRQMYDQNDRLERMVELLTAIRDNQQAQARTVAPQAAQANQASQAHGRSRKN